MPRAKDPAQARALREKVERDLEFAAGAAVRVSKLFVRLAVEPKVELARKFVRAILDDEEPR